jgi:hypothetical protein
MVSSASPTETIQKMVRVEVHYIKISSSHSAKKNIIRKVNMGSTQKKHQKNVCNKYKKNEVHNIQNSKFRYTQKENHSTNRKNKTHQHQDLREKDMKNKNHTRSSQLVYMKHTTNKHCILKTNTHIVFLKRGKLNILNTIMQAQKKTNINHINRKGENAVQKLVTEVHKTSNCSSYIV